MVERSRGMLPRGAAVPWLGTRALLLAPEIRGVRALGTSSLSYPLNLIRPRPSISAFPWGVILVSLAFIAMGAVFASRFAIEVDEALVGNGIYERAAPWYSWHIFGAEIPIMILTYAGALKAWLYNGLFALWPPSPLSLRLPMVVIGAITILLFYRLLDRVAGRRAAWIGCILLATDTTWLLTETIEYGIVAFQQLFKIGGILLLLRFDRTGSRRALALAFALFGLGVWDKALFLWQLIGLALAILLIFPGELRRHFTKRNLAVAAVSFCAGAFPFLYYNVAHPLETFRKNTAFSAAGLGAKFYILRETIDGDIFFGFLTASDTGPHPGQPRSVLGRAAFEISDAFGEPRHNLMSAALLVALLAIPLLWRTSARRPLLFAFIYLGATWLQMTLVAGAGGAAHHAVLLWPFHVFLIAVVFAEASVPLRRLGRPLVAAVVGVIAASNLLVTNQYYVDFVRNGAAIRWTDAINPLIAYLGRLRVDRVFVLDWGMLETINLLSQGAIPVQEGFGVLAEPSSPGRRAFLEAMISDPDNVFVTHTPGREVYPGMSARLDAFAAAEGYRREPLQTIYDRNGRAIFDVYRFRRGAG